MYHVTGLAELKSELAKVRHASASPFSRPPLTWKNCLAVNEGVLQVLLAAIAAPLNPIRECGHSLLARSVGSAATPFPRWLRNSHNP